MTLLTDHWSLTENWENVSLGNTYVRATPVMNSLTEWCVATSDADADLLPSGHAMKPGSDFVWEASAAGQNLYLRVAVPGDPTDEIPRVTITFLP